MCMLGARKNGGQIHSSPPRCHAQVDNWALGVCIYQWTFGKLPFSGCHTSGVFESICKQALVLPPDIPISDALADLITSASPLWQAVRRCYDVSLQCCRYYLVHASSRLSASCIVDAKVDWCCSPLLGAGEGSSGATLA